MAQLRFFMLKNAMLFANGVANVLGFLIVNNLTQRIEMLNDLNSALRVDSGMQPLLEQMDALFNPVVFVMAALVIIWFEWPIRGYLNALVRKEKLTGPEKLLARRRLLNEPYFVIALDFGIWVLAATVYGGILLAGGASREEALRPILVNISSGLITATVVFFELEFIIQKRLAPHFFPHGGQSSIPGTWRVRIRNRLVALFLAINLVPFIIILSLVHVTTLIRENPGHLLLDLQQALRATSVLFIALGVILTALVSVNLSRPFKNITQVLQAVRNGIFTRKVRVSTNDEIGYTGDVINEMTQGLQERDRMRQSLALAMEVQQRLLPKTSPRIPGLDVAGRSIYCDETGGDYFDYLEFGQECRDCLGLAVGDVSDHGIQSALLMTTARAFLRQRASRRGPLSEIMADVNRQLARDVEESGQFMTMFYGEVDVRRRSLSWVRAGHEPALLYHRATHKFIDLGGRGLALGLIEEADFEELHRPLKGGEILIMATDGIWEAQNVRGQQFGKEAMKRVIRDNSQGGAAAIVDAVLEAVQRFSGRLASRDDVTLVVVKVDFQQALAEGPLCPEYLGQA